MKLGLQLSPADAALSDKDLAAKGFEALAKALKQARPDLRIRTNTQVLDGGDMAFVGDMADKMAAAYQARCDKMLNDIATLLVQEAPEGGARS